MTRWRGRNKSVISHEAGRKGEKVSNRQSNKELQRIFWTKKRRRIKEGPKTTARVAGPEKETLTCEASGTCRGPVGIKHSPQKETSLGFRWIGDGRAGERRVAVVR